MKSFLKRVRSSFVRHVSYFHTIPILGGRYFLFFFLFSTLSFGPLLAYATLFSAATGLFAQKTVLAKEDRVLTSQNIPLLQASSGIDPRPTLIADPVIVDRSALLAESGPLGAHVEEEYKSETISTYVVRKGDTLSTVAEMFNVSQSTIVWANDLKSKTLREGDLLVILPVTGVKYTVKAKDTLETIAAKFKGDSRDIADFNGLSESDPLAVGTEIIIPEGEMPAPVVPKKPTAVVRVGGAVASSGSYLWPVPGGVLTQGLHGHNGVDIGAPTGQPVVAALGGTVILSRGGGGWNGGYGNYIVIAHANGTQTLYSHLSSIGVSTGERVARGQYVGAVGSTGRSTGPHLHFEVRGASNPFR